MVQLISIDEKTAVAGQLALADLKEIAAHGVTLVVNNRPDGESSGQPTSSEFAAEAAKHGIKFVTIPFGMPGLMTPGQVAEFAALLEQEEGKILAYCRSGMRSAAIWAAANVALGNGINDIMTKIARAGYDMRQAASFLQDLGQAAARAKQAAA